MTNYENQNPTSLILPIKSRDKNELISFFQMKNSNLKTRMTRVDQERKEVYQKLYHLTDFYIKNLEETKEIDEEKYYEIVEFNGLHRLLELINKYDKAKKPEEKEKELAILNRAINDRVIYFKQAYGYIPLEDIQNDPLILHRKELKKILDKLPMLRDYIEEQKNSVPNKIDKRLINTELVHKEYAEFIKIYNSLITSTYLLTELTTIVESKVQKANPETDVDDMSKKVIKIINHFNNIVELVSTPITDLGGKFKLEGEAFLIVQGLRIDLDLERDTGLKKA